MTREAGAFPVAGEQPVVTLGVTGLDHRVAFGAACRSAGLGASAAAVAVARPGGVRHRGVGRGRVDGGVGCGCYAGTDVVLTDVVLVVDAVVRVPVGAVVPLDPVELSASVSATLL